MVRGKPRLNPPMPDQKGKYSLDELLRAKRDEKPDSAFWVEFDRELKAKQRKLVQRQIVADDSHKSPFAIRFYRIAAFGSAAGFAAFAVYFGLQSGSHNDAVAENPLPAVQAEKPTFTVAVTESAPAPAAAEGLKEFAAVAETPRPRIVVEHVNPAPVPTASAVAAASAPRAAKSHPSADLKGMNLEFLNATGLFDDPTLASTTETESQDLNSLPSFEQSYALGKYADPLNGRYSRQATSGTAGQPQAVSFAEIDDFLSNQGNRGVRSLDSVTLRF